MNFSTFSLTILLISMPLQSSAGIASWFSFSAWVQVAQRSYKRIMRENQTKEKWYEQLKSDVTKLSPLELNKSAQEREQEFKAWQRNKKTLERLYQIRNETDNLRKIYSAIGKGFSPEETKDIEFVQTLRRDRYKLAKLFTDKQQDEWQLYGNIQPIDRVNVFQQEILEPAIRNVEKQVTATPSLSKSWYEQLKEQEFRAWQQKNGRTRLELSAASMNLQAKRDAQQKNS